MDPHEALGRQCGLELAQRRGREVRAVVGVDAAVVAFSVRVVDLIRIEQLGPTAGDDRDIMIHETATGLLKYRLMGHRGAVTSLQFLPQAQLLSAGRDNALRLWQLVVLERWHQQYVDPFSGTFIPLGAPAVPLSA